MTPALGCCEELIAVKFPRFWFALLVVLLPSAVPAAGPHGIQYGQPYTDQGVVVLTDQVAQAIADTGAGFVRVNFRLGSQTYDSPAWYAAYDGIVNRLRSRGLVIVALMTNEAWPGSSAQWQENNHEVAGGDGWNTYLNNWCNFFLRAATHWQGQIKYWELWNEPDCLASIQPSNFAALLSHAYDLAHTNNIPVEIISGGVCGGWCDPYTCTCDNVFGPNFIRNTYDMGINHTGLFTQMKAKWGTYPLDHVGFHIYPSCNTTLDTAWLLAYFDCVHNTYATAAYEGTSTTKKMWLTEIGWMTDGSGCHTTEATQASNITSFHGVVNNKTYIKCSTYFFLQDVPVAGLYFGVFRSSGLGESDKKPGWTNMKTQLTFEGRWAAGGTPNQPILEYFNAQGHARMGNPYNNGGTAWVHNWDYGPVQDYDGGDLGRMTIFDSADGTGCAVRGSFWQALFSGSNHPDLEFPLGGQFFTGAGDKQYFEGGYMTWTQAGGTQVTLYAHRIPLDNSDTGFTASASWTSTTVSDAYKDGKCRRRAATTTNTDPATWTLSVPQTGHYDVYARWPTYTNASTTATYEIVHASGTASVTVNQATRRARWNRLGGQSYEFAAGSAVIRLSSQGDSGKYLLGDAVRLVGPVGGPDTTPPTTPVVADDGQYQTSLTQLRATWASEDVESGIDRYEYAIGTSPTDPGSGYLVSWTSTGTENSVTKTIALTQGVTYYFYVRAYNRLGMMSAGLSDGIKVDTTRSSTPVVIDDGDYTGDATQLHCSWLSSDAESGIATYEYSAGTSPTYTDLVPVGDAGAATQVWATGLNLTMGKTYFFRARARNGAGLWSPYGYSNGVVYQPAQQPVGIPQALAFPDSTVVLLRSKTISALFLDRFYIEELDRPHGLAVSRSAALAEGSAVDVTGILQTSAGERVLAPGCVTPLP